MNFREFANSLQFIIPQFSKFLEIFEKKAIIWNFDCHKTPMFNLCF